MIFLKVFILKFFSISISLFSNLINLTLIILIYFLRMILMKKMLKNVLKYLNNKLKIINNFEKSRREEKYISLFFIRIILILMRL